MKFKIKKIEKIVTDHDHDKYITTPEFNKLTAEAFAARIAQAYLASKSDIANFVKKIDFDVKLKDLNKKNNSKKTKHVLVENELNELTEVKLFSTKDYSFFLGRIYFTSDDVSHNMFAYQPTLNVLELKIDRGTENIVGWKSK